MKKETRKLQLSRETLRLLDDRALNGPRGGTCFTTTAGEECQSTACIVETNCVNVCG